MVTTVAEMSASTPDEPTLLEVRLDGRRHTGLDWGGSGRDLVLLHPNGFGAGVFDPLARLLRTRHRVVGLDLGGQGQADPPGDLAAFRMLDVADEVLAVLAALDVRPPYLLLGHSLGGVIATLVDRAAPGAVERLVLCEPVIFPRDLDRPPSTMADGARRRRAIWPSIDAMRERYREAGPLAELDPRALDGYLRHGTVTLPTGEIALATPPEIEALIFEITQSERGGYPAWDHLPALEGRATIISGTTTNLPDDLFARQAERARVPHLRVDGGHLFPAQYPEATAALVADLLAPSGG